MSFVKNTDVERICITHEDTLNSLKCIQSGKASGPHNIGSKLLKTCAEQFVNLFCKLFQASLDQSTVPNVCKISDIISVDKNNHLRV